jgi:CDP-glucose 4,6-dehydratase
VFGECYRNRRVLLTGHTGFKGSWLALWLQSLGAHVIGIALAPDPSPNHWNLLNLALPSHHIDIRDAATLAGVVKEANPEIVFHLAAQSLVRRSYRTPLETWETNVMGTANLLEACRGLPNLKAVVVVTTDKCYENKESAKGYIEEDRLGGHDPYSASKASVELVASSYRDAFFAKEGILIATARAGNVIGGGDWSEDRIIPDLARAQAKGQDLIVRSPDATRPWQHVLEPLAGYLQLGQKLLEDNKKYEGPWNFGPDSSGALSVSDLLNRMKAKWKAVPDKTLHETTMLQLDSSKARIQLPWKPVWSIDQQLEMTAEWYRAYQSNGTVISKDQLAAYQQAAKAGKAAWV